MTQNSKKVRYLVEPEGKYWVVFARAEGFEERVAWFRSQSRARGYQLIENFFADWDDLPGYGDLPDECIGAGPRRKGDLPPKPVAATPASAMDAAFRRAQAFAKRVLLPGRHDLDQEAA